MNKRQIIPQYKEFCHTIKLVSYTKQSKFLQESRTYNDRTYVVVCSSSLSDW